MLHLADCLLRPLDHPAHYYLEVIEGATPLHSRDSRPLIDARALGGASASACAPRLPDRTQVLETDRL